jgi:hypothetical protein
MQISPCFVYRTSLLCVMVYGLFETFIYDLIQIIRTFFWTNMAENRICLTTYILKFNRNCYTVYGMYGSVHLWPYIN